MADDHRLGPGRAAPMAITIRASDPQDACPFLEVDHTAVRGTAARDRPPAVIAGWAPLPVTDAAVRRFLLSPGGEARLVTEARGAVVGVAAPVPGECEPRACHVAPQTAREGVGSALVREIERIARGLGLSRLDLEAFLTAGPSSTALGYAVRGCGEHGPGSGATMARASMGKSLR